MFKPNLKSFITYKADGAPGDSGVAVKPAEGTEGIGDSPTQSPEQVELEKLQAQLAAQKQQYEQDISKIKSSSDKRFAQQERQYMDALKERTTSLDTALLERMTPEDQIAHLKTRMAQDQELYKKEREAAAQSVQEQAAIQNAIQAFARFDISIEDLDTSSAEAVTRSGWLALDRRFTELKKMPDDQTPSPRDGQDLTQPAAQNTTEVVTSQNRSAQPPPMTSEEMLKKAALAITGKDAVTWEETMTLIESGKINVNEVLKTLKP